MGAIERARYELVCPKCGLTGKAEWSDYDGFTYMRHGPHPSVDVSEGLSQKRLIARLIGS